MLCTSSAARIGSKRPFVDQEEVMICLICKHLIRVDLKPFRSHLERCRVRKP